MDVHALGLGRSKWMGCIRSMFDQPNPHCCFSGSRFLIVAQLLQIELEQFSQQQGGTHPSLIGEDETSEQRHVCSKIIDFGYFFWPEANVA